MKKLTSSHWLLTALMLMFIGGGYLTIARSAPNGSATVRLELADMREDEFDVRIALDASVPASGVEISGSYSDNIQLVGANAKESVFPQEVVAAEAGEDNTFNLVRLRFDEGFMGEEGEVILLTFAIDGGGTATVSLDPDESQVIEYENATNILDEIEDLEINLGGSSNLASSSALSSSSQLPTTPPPVSNQVQPTAIVSSASSAPAAPSSTPTPPATTQPPAQSFQSVTIQSTPTQPQPMVTYVPSSAAQASTPPQFVPSSSFGNYYYPAAPQQTHQVTTHQPGALSTTGPGVALITLAGAASGYIMKRTKK